MATPSSSTDPSLLILPTLTWPFQRSSLRSAYRPTIRTVLRKVADSLTDRTSRARLDIALVLSSSSYLASPASPRSTMFTQTQSLLEETYSLLCTIAAAEHIDLDFPGGIDARIFLLDARTQGQAMQSVIGNQPLSGPLIDLHTFAAAGRPYAAWYAAEGAASTSALDDVLSPFRLRRGGQRNLPRPPTVERVPYGAAVGVSSSTKPAAAVAAEKAMAPAPVGAGKEHSTTQHTSVAVGGTFDHLHIGHKLLLSATVFLAEPAVAAAAGALDDQPQQRRRHITVGITGDALLVNKKFAAQVNTWEARQAETAAFVESILVFAHDVQSIRTEKQMTVLDEEGKANKAVLVSYGAEGAGGLSINYVEINDPFGPTITEEHISALVVSAETRKGGAAVNEKRRGKGWDGLEVFEVDVLDAREDEREGGGAEQESFDAKISSTEIRRRLAEREEADRGREVEIPIR